MTHKMRYPEREGVTAVHGLSGSSAGSAVDSTGNRRKRQDERLALAQEDLCERARQTRQHRRKRRNALVGGEIA